MFKISSIITPLYLISVFQLYNYLKYALYNATDNKNTLNRQANVHVMVVRWWRYGSRSCHAKLRYGSILLVFSLLNM